MKKLLAAAAILLATGSAYAGDKRAAGTEGTCTSWEGDKVILIEECDAFDDGTWDYVECVRALRLETARKLCARGVGTYKWCFQVGSEPSKLCQITTCK